MAKSTKEERMEAIRQRMADPVKSSGRFIAAFWAPYDSNESRRERFLESLSRAPVGIMIGLNSNKKLLDSHDYDDSIVKLVTFEGDSCLDIAERGNKIDHLQCCRDWLKNLVDFTERIIKESNESER
jgi:hypothetical protein